MNTLLNNAAAGGTGVKEASPAAVRTCLVQLGRYGDILNLLPVAHAIAQEEGGKVAMLVHREFMDLMEAVSYVEPVQWDGDPQQPTVASRTVKGRFERVIIAQVADNSHARQRICEAFNMDQWHNCGFLDRWTDSELRLVLDRRSREREAKLLESLRLRGRPYILVNVRGISSAFHFEDQLVNDLQMKWANEALIVDTRRFKAAKFQDMLGLIDNAICMVSIDTSTLHLAGASRTPVIALICDYIGAPVGRVTDLWCGSNLRLGNIALSMRYGEYQHRRNEINHVIRQILENRHRVLTGRLDFPVTLVGVDNFTPARTIGALWFSQRMVQSPETILFCRPGNQIPGGDLRGVKVRPVIHGTDRASREIFLSRELHKHIETSHCLHIEWDARIANPAAWDPAWLEYDYIGAPWPWPFEQIPIPWAEKQPTLTPCGPGNCVGNMGFALISKRFSKAVDECDPPLHELACSDIFLCRTLRPKLEEMGIRFAPEIVAAQFSCEGRYFCSNFGWHGQGTAAMNGFKLL